MKFIVDKPLGEINIILVNDGWEPFLGESAGNVWAYLKHTGSNTYMLTVSDDYVKLIVKGATKAKNITLVQTGALDLTQINRHIL